MDLVKKGCGQSGHGTQACWDAGFLHVGTNSGKLKVDSMTLGGGGDLVKDDRSFFFLVTLFRVVFLSIAYLMVANLA